MQLYDAAVAKRAAVAALGLREAQARAVDGAISERVAALRLVIVERDLLLRCPRCFLGHSNLKLFYLPTLQI